MSNFSAPGNQPNTLSTSLGLSDPRLRRSAQGASLLEHQYGEGIHVDSKGRLAIDIKKLASNKVFITDIVRSFFSMTIKNTYEGDTIVNEGDDITNNWYVDESVTNNYTFDVNDPDPNIVLFFNGLIEAWIAALPIGEQMTLVRQCIGFLNSTGGSVDPPPWTPGDTTILSKLEEIVAPTSSFAAHYFNGPQSVSTSWADVSMSTFNAEHNTDDLISYDSGTKKVTFHNGVWTMECNYSGRKSSGTSSASYVHLRLRDTEASTNYAAANVHVNDGSTRYGPVPKHMSAVVDARDSSKTMKVQTKLAGGTHCSLYNAEISYNRIG